MYVWYYLLNFFYIYVKNTIVYICMYAYEKIRNSNSKNNTKIIGFLSTRMYILMFLHTYVCM